MDTTVDMPAKRHFQKRIVFYVFAMSFGSVSFGYASAIIATTLGQPSFQKYMNLTKTNPHTATIRGAMNSLFYAGGFFGALFNSWCADRFGRKKALATGATIMIISSALCAGSVTVSMFIVFRFFTGWSCLMLLVCVPLWITEIAPPRGRGVLANIHGLMAVLGYLIANYTGVGFYYYQNGSGEQWRAPLAFACLFPLVLLSFLPFLPESPRWLLAHDRSEDAWKIVERLHRTNDDPHGEYAQSEFLQMRKQLELDMSLDSSWKVILTRPSYLKRAAISCCVLTFIYNSGVLVISNYGPTIFAELGYGTAQTLQLQAATVCVSTCALCISLFVVDRIPRNVCLSVGMFLVAIPLSIEAAMAKLYVGTTNKSGLSARAAIIYVYIFFYGIFLDGPGYFYASELWPTHLRSKGATMCIASYALINIMWTQVAPIAMTSIKWKFYMVFVALCVVQSAIMFFFFPNTLNKPLEEVAALFGDEDLVAIFEREAVQIIQHGDEKVLDNGITVAHVA